MRALITGASSGIGKALAVEFAKKKYDLVLVARRKEVLEANKKELVEKYGIKVDIEIMDLSITKNLTDLITKYEKGKIDILVNNAGFGDAEYFINQNTSTVANMIGINVNALAILTNGFAKSMVKNKQGTIINISSIIAVMQNAPTLALYNSTKRFVMSLSQAVNAELKFQKTNVRVLTICPGLIRTEFAEVAKMEKMYKRATTVSKFANKVVNKALKSKKDIFFYGKNSKSTQWLKIIPRKIKNKFILKFKTLKK